jgi:uncharacterized protein YaiE (UPF0345 family)
MAKNTGFPPLFGIFALLIGALQIVSTLTFDVPLLTSGTRTTGVIEKVELSRRTATLSIRYTLASGEPEVLRTAQNDRQGYQAGQQVPIVYLPGNARMGEIDTGGTMWVRVAVKFAFGLFCLGGGIMMWTQRRRAP